MLFKNSVYYLALATFLFTGLVAQAQKTIVTSFEVSGVCTMCEDRIEKAMDVRGVKMADYSLETHLLEIAYNPAKISEDEIHNILNEVGHDTEKSTASDAQYETVHTCCKYRGHEDH